MVRSRFRRVALAVALLTLASAPPRALAQDPSPIVKDWDYVSVGTAATLAERLPRIDAVVYAEVESSTGRLVPPLLSPLPPEIERISVPDVVTDHVLKVFAVLKEDGHVPHGGVLTVEQVGGKAPWKDTSIVLHAGPLLRQGEYYVLLLKWLDSRNLFAVSHSDVFRIVDGRVASDPLPSYGQPFAGGSVETLLDAITMTR
jgi:hypothetical protein